MNSLIKKTILAFVIGSMVLSSLTVCAVGNTADYYVDINAASGGDGSIDRPFNDIASALSKVKGLKGYSQATVILREGKYFLKNTLDLSSKQENMNITIKGYEDECVEILGGVKVNYSSAKPIEDLGIYKSLRSSARDKIVSIDLKSYNISDYGSFSLDGKKNKTAAQLYYNEKPLTVARYPNFGYDNFKNVSAQNGTASVKYGELFNSNWRKESNPLITYYETSGFVSYNTDVDFDSIEPVFNVKKAGGLAENGRFYLWNMLSEIDLPGEYYIDTENDILYLYPVSDNMGDTLVLSTLTKNLVNISYSKNITLENLTFSTGAANGLSLNNCENISIKGCVIKNFTGDGVALKYCNDVKVDGCDISNTGFSGVQIAGGGNIETLEPSGIEITNNDIYNFNILGKADSGNGVMLLWKNAGEAEYYYCVAPKIQNNRIHDAPCIAIYFKGALEPYIGHNEIYNVCREVLDNGAIYAGRTAALRNTVIENNFFHNINKYEGAAGSHVYCVYADDNLNNVISANNVFYQCEYPFIMGGGSDHVIDNNLFVDCTNTILFDDRGLNWSASSLIPNIKASLIDMPWQNKVWTERYPEIAWMFDETKLGVGYPQRNLITNNMILNSGSESIVKTVIENGTVENNEHFDTGYSFEDKKGFDLSLTEDSAVLKAMPEYENIDTSEIGLTRDVENNDFSLLHPQNNQYNVEGANAEFLWEKSAGADAYHLMVALDENFDNVVVDEVLFENYYTFDKLRYNSTKYYWKVETVKLSKNDASIPSKSGVYSFTTKKEEDRDTEELEALVAAIDSKCDTIVEGTEAGQYPEGSKEKIKSVLTEAKNIIPNLTIKQNQVKKMLRVLKNTEEETNHSLNYDVIDFSEILNDKENWALGETGVITEDGFESTAAGNFGYLGKKIPSTGILKFKANFQLTNFQGFGLNYVDPTVDCWKSEGYCILIKRDIIELQRRGGSAANGIVATFVNEDKILSDTWYDFEIGKINTYNGTRIIMKVDGKTIIDFVDSTEYAQTYDGYFAIYDASQGGFKVK